MFLSTFETVLFVCLILKFTILFFYTKKIGLNKSVKVCMCMYVGREAGRQVGKNLLLPIYWTHSFFV